MRCINFRMKTSSTDSGGWKNGLGIMIMPPVTAPKVENFEQFGVERMPNKTMGSATNQSCFLRNYDRLESLVKMFNQAISLWMVWGSGEREQTVSGVNHFSNRWPCLLLLLFCFFKNRMMVLLDFCPLNGWRSQKRGQQNAFLKLKPFYDISQTNVLILNSTPLFPFCRNSRNFVFI